MDERKVSQRTRFRRMGWQKAEDPKRHGAGLGVGDGVGEKNYE